ncbi:MAG: cell division protein FtsQ/DivIB [Flavobacteriales bacterium]
MKAGKNILQHDLKRHKRRRMWLVNGLAITGGLVLFTLLGFVHKKQKDTTCWKMEVLVNAPDGKKFISEATITRIAMQAQDSILGSRVDAINLKTIHEQVAAISSVKDARVYTTVDGRLMISVSQRTPVARIFNHQGESFYLDDDGFTMALSDECPARVPVFVGSIPDQVREGSFMDKTTDGSYMQSTMLDDIYAFTNFISANEFWKAQVEHVHVNNAGEFEIIPRVGSHRINMGKAENLEEKFKKLMAFYAHTVHTNDLNKYSMINVEYNGQIVCVRR